MSEIRYFADYCKSNEIILEERAKRDKEMRNNFANLMYALVVGFIVLEALEFTGLTELKR